MEAHYYTDKSIAVYGDTKPWLNNLKSLGGRFNNNLGGQPGWIFPIKKQNELVDFITKANAGQIQPAPSSPKVYGTPPLTSGQVPVMSTQTTLYPQAVAHPQISPPQVYIRPQIPTTGTQIPYTSTGTQIPQVSMGTQIPYTSTGTQIPQASKGTQIPQASMGTQILPKLPNPQPVSVLEIQPQEVSFPNQFVAADGIVYQIVMYTAPLPSVGQRLTINVDEDTRDYSVSTLESNDSIIINPVEISEGEEDQSLRVVLIRGEWKLSDIQGDHTIKFHPHS